MREMRERKERSAAWTGIAACACVAAVAVAAAGYYYCHHHRTHTDEPPAVRTVAPIPMDDADAASFFTGEWFVQWQTETRYLKRDYNARVKASYTQQPPSWFGYTVGIRNVAHRARADAHADAHAAVRDSGTRALTRLGAQRHPDSNGLAKFVVAPHFVPARFAGDYWIIARATCGPTEFAVVCGGQPTIADPLGGGYTYDTDATNNSGLWILTRTQNPQNALAVYERASAAIRSNGISLRGLARVDQSNSPEDPA